MTEAKQEFSPEEEKKMQKEVQKHFQMFKKRFKTKPKSELVAILWQQGVEFKKLQDIAQELYEENKALKETTNETSQETNESAE